MLFTDWFWQLFKLGFEAGEPLQSQNDGLDYNSLHPWAITKQPTQDTANTNRNQNKDASSQTIENQRCRTL
ncbi:hypothetical protein DPMN_017894 [Dreissena polymorpha]|uniref:Uncharacterized protein n=1 Tax=Dreissena polymorpha TaxID=45954 RepID=A0A9D4S5W5_DREPO|nr:hypothetical protein DPMN_017894 [Dreissena polymorpha]